MQVRRWFVCLSCLTGFLRPAVAAVPDSTARALPQRYDYRFVKNAQPWLSSGNPAGLSALSFRHIAQASVAFNKGNGGLVNYNGSDNDYSFDLGAEAFTRVGERWTFGGQIDYTYYHGKNMAGSAFIEPLQMPFDLVDVKSLAGDKQRERYHLAGSVAYTPLQALSIGLQADYTAGNYAKMKDLRHTNHLLDLKLTAGLSWRFSPLLRLGAHYRYRSRVETLAFQQSGESTLTYSQLISYGAFYGKDQVFSANTYVSSASQPVRDSWHGGAVQASFDFSGGGTLMLEAGVSARSGHYGIPGSKTEVFSAHKGMDYGAQAALNLPDGTLEHRIRLEGNYATLHNEENVFRYVNQPETGNTVIEYIGANERLNRGLLEARASYLLCIGTQQMLPVWEAGVQSEAFLRTLTVPLYPFFRQQKVFRIGLQAGGLRRFVWGRHLLGAGARAGFAAGSGKVAEDGTYIPPATDQKIPAENRTYLMQEYEFYTRPCLSAALSMQYGLLLGKKMDASLGFDLGWRHAFSPTAVGADRLTFSIGLGLNF